MDIKQRLKNFVETRTPIADDPPELELVLCRDALAEIERLEKEQPKVTLVMTPREHAILRDVVASQMNQTGWCQRPEEVQQAIRRFAQAR
jgi:hypothetical protein